MRFLGFLMSTMAMTLAFVAIINVSDHPERATACGVLAIVFILWENQISKDINEDRGWWR